MTLIFNKLQILQIIQIFYKPQITLITQIKFQMRKRMNFADWRSQDIFGHKSIENLT